MVPASAHALLGLFQANIHFGADNDDTTVSLRLSTLFLSVNSLLEDIILYRQNFLLYLSGPSDGSLRLHL